jgi:hypothetical protein
MGLYQYIGLLCLITAGIIFIGLCVTFKSVWIKPKAILLKPEEIKRTEMKVEDTSKKGTKYNNFWKKIWDK